MPLAGRVSVNVIGAVEAPVPELVAMSVHVMASPMEPPVLLTLFVTVTLGVAAAATVVVVVQLAAALQLAPVPGATVLTRLAAVVVGAETSTDAVPLVAARPAAIVHVSVLPVTGLRVAPVGVTVTAPMPLAGRVSVSVIAAVVGPPVLSAVSVQLTVLPTLVDVLSTLALTVTLGGTGAAATAVVVLQSAADSQLAAPAPEGATMLARVPTVVAVPEMMTLALLPGAKPPAMVQVSVLTAGPQVAPVACHTRRRR